MKYLFSLLVVGGFLFSGLMSASLVMAQAPNEMFGFKNDVIVPEALAATTSTSTYNNASTTAAGIIGQQLTTAPTSDITRPEELPEKVAIITLFEARPVNNLSILNAMAYWVQESVRQGVPANTIFLILLTPLLALLVSFVRVVLGFPTLDMLVPIALSFALVAAGITVGLLVLGAILIASYVAKKSLLNLRIMFYPKRSLSMAFLSISVFAALTLGVMLEIERILTVSIFPILILMLLGDMIVSVQLHKSSSETFIITGTTIIIGLIGYFAATSGFIQSTIILYPEIVLLVIPLNLIIGRYFGLRVLELFRFSKARVN